jgi:transketolase
MNKTDLLNLKNKIKNMRLRCLKMIYESKSGHPGGSMSLADILAVLYFYTMDIDPSKPDLETRDRLILSKGHGAPMLYSVLCEKGFFSEEEIQSFRKTGGLLQGHPVLSVPGVDATSGSLGCGLSMGIGMAMGLKFRNYNSNVFVIIGDGELNEGIIWESIMAAKHFYVDNLIAIIDHNHFQNDGPCTNVLDIGPLLPKFKAFGWEADQCDGHDILLLSKKLGKLKDSRNNKPKVLIAETIKGYGVSYLVNDYRTHYSPPTTEQYESALRDLQ